LKVTELFSIVHDDLTAVEKELLSLIQSPLSFFSDIGTHLVQAGGKRLRPALFLLCAKQSESENPERLHLAAAIELIHMATLVHDDVIDVAETRRGKPTANRIFGNHCSVLTGDYLFAKAFSLVAQFSGPDRLRILTDAICVMCEGEIFQARDLYCLDQTISDYFKNINCKTADFIAASCYLGGQAAHYQPASIDALRRYGYCIGMAFQITDDIFDVIATAEAVGKPTGNDLKQGVLTLPVLYALQHGCHQNELRQIIQSKDITGERLEQALGFIREGNAVDYCYEQAENYLQQAREVLPECLPGNIHEALITVANFIGKRIY
jgi:heptaprenyl diphosphate synthase